MSEVSKNQVDVVITWCKSVLGEVTLLSDHSKDHGGHESSTQRIRVAGNPGYLKIHESPGHWRNEVHAYRTWTAAFGNHAPRLLAVRNEPPLAIVMSEVPGNIAEHADLSPAQEKALWRAAGAALVSLHTLERGKHFGPSTEDDAPAQKVFRNAEDYMTHKIIEQREQASALNLLTDDELAVTKAALDLIPAFEGEQPVPCHRDYGPANWLIDSHKQWTGVIDFEFAYWDVRVADFSRYPDWTWLHRPELIEAFFDGYGRALSDREQRQRLVAYVDYALSAIIWGRENAFFGFEREGRDALAYLAPKV